jgi:hypothetical protein
MLPAVLFGDEESCLSSLYVEKTACVLSSIELASGAI